MNCKHARHQMALAVGGDVSDVPGLPQHLDLCPECTRFRSELNMSYAALEAYREATSAETAPTDAASIRRMLKTLWKHPASRQKEFNGWIPLAVVAAAVVAVALFIPWWTQPLNQPIRIDSTVDVHALPDQFEPFTPDPSWQAESPNGRPQFFRQGRRDFTPGTPRVPIQRVNRSSRPPFNEF